MAKNTGKPSETFFENVWIRLGKRAFSYRIADAAEVRGRTGNIGTTRATPSDYVVTFDGVTFYAEVKSTQEKISFPFSLLKKGQKAAAPQVVAAGGGYFVFVHSLTTDTWYRVPFEVIAAVKAIGRSSIPWSEMETLKWKIPLPSST
jgi:penicillin-binding protein-related factor A (putative recombinase)